MKRIYHSIDRWEEIEFGMWSDIEDSKAMLGKAIEFTGNHNLYGKYMIRVINEWPISCENALTEMSGNRKAWVGHAACALAIGCPEDITRKAWGFLSSDQQEMANRQAASAIEVWERAYGKDRGVYQSVAGALL